MAQRVASAWLEEPLKTTPSSEIDTQNHAENYSHKIETINPRKSQIKNFLETVITDITLAENLHIFRIEHDIHHDIAIIKRQVHELANLGVSFSILTDNKFHGRSQSIFEQNCT